MQIEQVVFSHDGKNNQLSGVSASIPKGKITTIIGPNGCGKSTLLSLISRNNKPITGSVQVEQKDVLDYKPKQFAKKLAIVYQQNDIPPQITVEQLVGYGRLPHQSFLKRDEQADRDAVEWALTCTNLLAKRQSDVSALSGGERQRVWIAMALAQRSEILCLDEPTTYLDIYYQIELLELVKQLNKTYGLTIVMVLHDINQALQYSDEIILMKATKVVAQGAPDDVITEQMMKDVYDVRVLFTEQPSIGRYMVPLSI